jgi:RecA-family ATPase
MPPLVWGQANLSAAAGTPRPWLWQGYLASGAVTLLTGQWKAGKTTLASILLARLKTGGDLAGLPLAAGQAVVVSEELPEHWDRRSRHLDFGDHVGWFCQPFRGRPRPDEWRAFIEGIADLRSRREFALVLIDALSAFFPGRGENNAACMLEALEPLRQLTRRSLSVLVLHHPGKGDPPVGQLARGSGALMAAADILLELRYYPKAPEDDRRRWLQALSRFPETPRQKVIEWTADGTDYVARGTFQEEEFAAHWEVLRPLLAAAKWKSSRLDIRQRWPGDERPDKVSLARWLERAVELGLLRKDGRGNKSLPYRYWLPEREEVWRQDPIAAALMPELLQTGHQL